MTLGSTIGTGTHTLQHILGMDTTAITTALGEHITIPPTG